MMIPERNKITKTQAWILASRPKTLPAAAAPVIIGSAAAFAEGCFRLLPALAALFGSLLLQIGANYANDVFDFQKGTDSRERLGPLRVTQAGLLSPQAVKTGMWLTFGAAAICGIYMTLVSGWLIVLIGVLAIAAAVAYSGGPFPYGYKGLGEVFVFLFFGIAAVSGTYYAQAGRVSLLAFLSGIPVGLLIVAILVVNNLRDVESDRAGDKNTLAVRFGAAWAQQEYIAVLALAYLMVFLLGLSNIAPAWIVLSWLSLPIIFPLTQTVLHERGRTLNRTLAGTGTLTLVFSLLYAAGLIIGFYFPI